MTDFVRRIIESNLNKILKVLGFRIHWITKRYVKKDDFYKLFKNYINYKCLKLHFGCGSRVLKGWINIDLWWYPLPDINPYPDALIGDKSDFYAIDITKLGLPLPNNSVDVIFHEDFLEHLNQRDQIIFLSETLRVLKPKAIHRVNTPNLLVPMEAHSNFSKGKSGVFIEEWDEPRHVNILTPLMLEELAKMIGYSKVIFNSRNNSTSKLIPLEYRPRPAKPEYRNIFADLIK
ncbi:MAG: methyltransferase domain-containing protein [Candidatus Hodarchaeota archaeon]